ncbi:ATP-binding protein [Massilia aquatica]|uniref:Rad50/SbcC-type AAA domain-containing protein n=1 Tax=Massilia aquatica TaxID=2609000 RepID=A0ABX0M7D3_9BURK|nr:ATP-binding protein [Massilia aquatica]NHZ42488.1 hypothetical protein [Massilia aquatica]
MIIRGVRFHANTAQGLFGFSFKFGRNLTIIRAGNSGGKSTLVNSLLYSLGMEEIVGGKGEKFLPYAVKDYVEHCGAKIPISSSEILVEIENKVGTVVTIRRAIKDSTRSTKLVEIFNGAHLTEAAAIGVPRPTYLHDPGGAQLSEGFHRYLEKFLGLTLPKVARTSGTDTKLYLQTIFAALAIEQKRGWTDYIANIPFFGIRDARTRVAEFILGLDVFETNVERSRLNVESVDIASKWRRGTDELKSAANRQGFLVENLPLGPALGFEKDAVGVIRIGTTATPLEEYQQQLNEEYETLSRRAEESVKSTGEATVQEIDKVTTELRELSVLYERSSSVVGMNRASLNEYQRLLDENLEDLEKNRTAAKLRTLGAKLDIEVATGHCPTCHQTVEDNLLADMTTGPQMDIVTNIAYLESQSRMLRRQVAGLQDAIGSDELRASELSIRLAGKHDYLAALRGDLSSGALQSKALVRRQVQIEIEISALDVLRRTALEVVGELDALLVRFKSNLLARKALPQSAYSGKDEVRIRAFEINFRANAGSFGYKSAPIEDIEISRENLVPGLSQLELREIIKDPRKSDIKSDSSASDFVRLIWSYLLALYQTSSNPNFHGNHLGVLIFDEPGQHAMRAESQHALLQLLAGEKGLQAIAAASFDELEEAFQVSTAGVAYELIEWDGKLIRPMSDKQA